MNKAPVSIMIPTKDEEKNLPFAIKSVIDWASDVFVLDSGSTDGTKEVAESLGAKFVYHEWQGYARSKNWGLDNLPFTTPWVFILDADEAITPELRDEIIRVTSDTTNDVAGYYINRFFIFLGKRIKHCGFYPSWNLRLLKRGKARYEEREVHEHMSVDGKVGYLKHDMEHNDRRGLAYSIAKHNHYSTLEAREMFKVITSQSAADRGRLFGGSPVEKRRWVKTVLWPKLPARWIARWIYMYFLRLGFMDGDVGFHFCLFMTSYEHQIDLKLREMLVEYRQGQKK
jgi:glycosyltransferase involved in cell wall biosynthesis